MNVLTVLSTLCCLTFASAAEYYQDYMDEDIKIGLKRVVNRPKIFDRKKLAFQIQPHPYPTLTMYEVEVALDDPKTSEVEKKVIAGIVNDFMTLIYGVDCPYTSGHTILPSECSITDVENAIAKATNKRFKDVYVHIAETYKSCDFTPQWTVNTGWDPKFKPVLVLISSHITGSVKSKYVDLI
ncbi:uncharacterized protein LOC128677429 [Plodia interpunctella]|uniref:uncharacterized protein LOC128677429 n=1 Tax=Plodia interpunctella TaxID=58824 RepID=UPI0023675EFB|nr:uncharacterized protein LOC128677429 [Plodia interpunctella]